MSFSVLSVPRILLNAELGLAALKVENVHRGILASGKRREDKQIASEGPGVLRRVHAGKRFVRESPVGGRRITGWVMTAERVFLEPAASHQNWETINSEIGRRCAPSNRQSHFCGGEGKGRTRPPMRFRRAAALFSRRVCCCLLA
jgi:hypothetical protein